MSKVSEVITKLQEMESEHGNLECNIYKSFEKETTPLNKDEIHFDEEKKDIYIGIYN